MELLKNEKKGYYLGINKDGEDTFLCFPSWDCDWYWGFGYIHTYKKRKKEFILHTHFDTLFLEHNIFESYVEYFKKSNLNTTEIYELLNLMKEFYVCKKYAELLQYGGYITTRKSVIMIEDFKQNNEKEVERINKIIIPRIFQEIDMLFVNKGV